MNSIPYKDGLYRTPPGRAGFFSRLLPGLFFYPRIIYTTVKASLLVALGKYSNWYWEVTGLETLRAIELAGATVEIEGMENLRSFEGPCVFIANHMSTLETYALPGILVPFRHITFVVKKSLVTYPVVGRVMRWMPPITVTRTNPREDLKAVLEEGSALLSQGRSVVIFDRRVGKRTRPQGLRHDKPQERRSLLNRRAHGDNRQGRRGAQARRRVHHCETRGLEGVGRVAPPSFREPEAGIARFLHCSLSFSKNPPWGPRGGCRGHPVPLSFKEPSMAFPVSFTLRSLLGENPPRGRGRITGDP
jgi:hypothetical protein